MSYDETEHGVEPLQSHVEQAGRHEWAWEKECGFWHYGDWLRSGLESLDDIESIGLGVLPPAAEATHDVADFLSAVRGIDAARWEECEVEDRGRWLHETSALVKAWLEQEEFALWRMVRAYEQALKGFATDQSRELIGDEREAAQAARSIRRQAQQKWDSNISAWVAATRTGTTPATGRIQNEKRSDGVFILVDQNTGRWTGVDWKCPSCRGPLARIEGDGSCYCTAGHFSR